MHYLDDFHVHNLKYGQLKFEFWTLRHLFFFFKFPVEHPNIFLNSNSGEIAAYIFTHILSHSNNI